VSSRADRVAARLAQRELDLLLVTDMVNVRYLTGFSGSNGLAIVGPDTRRFLTDFRYVERARAEVDGFDLQRAPQELSAALGEGWPAGPVRLGFEDQHVSVRRHGALRRILPDRIELVAAGGVVEAERAIKEPVELDAIRAAAALADEVYEWLAEQGLVGRTEREVALALEQEMRVRGAEGPAFASIVAAAENGALPHATPRDVAIPGDALVTLDIGARVDGYCSDCTRTWATGSLDDDLSELYDTVLHAQRTALSAVRPGPEGREIDAIARDIITAAGHGDHFGHGLGHGVGLDVHEAPRLARTAEGRLEAGHVVTVEPGIYLPGRGGARIEDLVVVIPDGHEVISGTTKEHRVVT
jgi:Xaa-Pro aminopeptidase